MTAIDGKASRGASFADGDMFYVLGADSKDYHLTAGDLFGNIPSSVVIEVDQTVEGDVTVTTTSTTALTVENAGGTDILLVDTSTPKVVIGAATPTDLYVGSSSAFGVTVDHIIYGKLDMLGTETVIDGIMGHVEIESSGGAKTVTAYPVTGTIDQISGSDNWITNLSAALSAEIMVRGTTTATIPKVSMIRGFLNISAAGATITELSGLRFQSNTVVGTVTTFKAIDIPTITGPSTKYTIYSEDANSTMFHEGTVEIGPNTATSQLILPLSNDAISPTFVIDGGDSGLYAAAADRVNIGLAGSYAYEFNSSGLIAANTKGFAVMQEESSATNPTLVPSRDSLTTGIGGVGATPDLSGIIAGAEIWRTTSTGFGIGGAPADGLLHVIAGSAGSVASHASANDVTIENSADCGLSVLCPDANKGNIFFGTVSDNIGAYLEWDYDGETNGLFTIGTHKASAQLRLMSASGVEAVRIDGSGHITTGTAGGPSLRQTASADATPTLCPDDAGTTTGVGGSATGVTLVAGGTERLICDDTGIAFFAAAAQAQQAHIVDADGTLADITTKFNTLLADLEGYGLLASA